MLSNYSKWDSQGFTSIANAAREAPTIHSTPVKIHSLNEFINKILYHP